MCQIFFSMPGNLYMNKTEIPVLMKNQIYSSSILMGWEWGLILSSWSKIAAGALAITAKFQGA